MARSRLIFQTCSDFTCQQSSSLALASSANAREEMVDCGVRFLARQFARGLHDKENLETAGPTGCQ